MDNYIKCELLETRNEDESSEYIQSDIEGTNEN